MSVLAESLTLQEIDVLLEALDKWVAGSLDGELTGMLFGAMFSDKLDEEGKAKFEEKQQKQNDEREAKRRERSEVATLLKAKLIMVRRQIAGVPL